MSGTGITGGGSGYAAILAHAGGALYGTELGSVTLKRIGFFCFPIKHSTHTQHTPKFNKNIFLKKNNKNDKSKLSPSKYATILLASTPLPKKSAGIGERGGWGSLKSRSPRPAILAESQPVLKVSFNRPRGGGGDGPSLHEKEVEKFLLAVVARFKAFKKRVPSKSCGGKRPQRASASKAKSSVLSQLSGLENVVFNDFIDVELDSEDVSEQRASASLPDSVPTKSEEERAAREADEMAVLDAVGDYETDPNVMLEDVPQDTRHRLEDSEGVECMCLQPAATAAHHTVRTETRYCEQAGGSRSLTHADGPV